MMHCKLTVTAPNVVKSRLVGNRPPIVHTTFLRSGEYVVLGKFISHGLAKDELLVGFVHAIRVEPKFLQSSF